MKLQHILAIVLFGLIASLPVQAQANTLQLPDEVSASDLKPNFPQPYVVKKGDTLWDIAEHFFKDPQKWLKVWERNLYISNPDLIYPGNEIWFNAQEKKSGGLTTVRPVPQVITKPVEKLEAPVDTSMLLDALKRQDFIDVQETSSLGYILDAKDDRLNFGKGDELYLKLNKPVEAGTLLDIYRSGDVIANPVTRKAVGKLVHHLGQIQVISESQGTYRGIVTEAFREISRADRLKPAKSIDTRIVRNFPEKPLNGLVIYIDNNAAEAGQHQTIGISLGSNDGLTTGTVLSVHKEGRTILDPVTKEKTRLPDEKIGEMIVLSAQPNASMAIITESSYAINRGDPVHSEAAH